jgi:hypothetical protein
MPWIISRSAVDDQSSSCQVRFSSRPRCSALTKSPRERLNVLTVARHSGLPYEVISSPSLFRASPGEAEASLLRAFHRGAQAAETAGGFILILDDLEAAAKVGPFGNAEKHTNTVPYITIPLWQMVWATYRLRWVVVRLGCLQGMI